MFKALIPAAALLACSAVVGAQSLDTVNFSCHLGSFKLYNGQGTLHFKFKGTILVTYLHGTVTLGGKVKKEYPLPTMQGSDVGTRQSFFGDGEITIKGDFKSLQWFGRDLTGSWTGSGGFRLFGDYDKNLETGFFWYGNQYDRRVPFSTGSGDLRLPPAGSNAPKPVLKG